MEVQPEVKSPHNKSLIYFSKQVYGRPTKSRNQDPSMYELLSWDNGLDKNCFRKKQKFSEPSQAYMNLIGKDQWTSETQQNFVNYHENCIQTNPKMLNRIENYIEQREPQAHQHKDTKIKNLLKVGEHTNLHNVKTDPGKKQLKENNFIDPSKTHKEQTNKSIENTHKKDPKINKTYQNLSVGLKSEKSSHQKVQKNEKDQSINREQQSKLIQKFKQTTRWIPNSAFTTYFGKPPFENYGRANTSPIEGGLIYGTYLYSHNVHPHRGNNTPKHLQTYPVALHKAKSQGLLIPTQPKTCPETTQTFQQNTANQSRLIEPTENRFGELKIATPNLREVAKFKPK